MKKIPLHIVCATTMPQAALMGWYLFDVQWISPNNTQTLYTVFPTVAHQYAKETWAIECRQTLKRTLQTVTHSNHDILNSFISLDTRDIHLHVKSLMPQKSELLSDVTVTRCYLWLAQLATNETLAQRSHDRTGICKAAEGRVNDTGFTPSVMILNSSSPTERQQRGHPDPDRFHLKEPPSFKNTCQCKNKFKFDCLSPI